MTPSSHQCHGTGGASDPPGGSYTCRMLTQEAISDLGTGSHNLVGGAHVADIKQTGWDRGLPRRPGRGRGDDRDDFHEISLEI